MWKVCDFGCFCPAEYRRGLDVGSCSSGNPFESDDFCRVMPSPPARVSGPPLTDVCYLNPKNAKAGVELAEESVLRPPSETRCDAIWARAPYLAWPRASTLFVGSVTSWPDALDRVLAAARNALEHVRAREEASTVATAQRTGLALLGGAP